MFKRKNDDVYNASQLVKKIAIVGLPNTGKSQVFSNLTHEYAIVANYPFTTIEMKRARCRIGGEIYEVIDTPGLHCLYIHSEEELIVRDMLFKEKPDIVLQCIDANRLKQSLTLTADLIEIGIPMVISLNAVDETLKKGIKIDSVKLSQILDIPVVESIAISDLGTEDIKEAITKAKKSKEAIYYEDIIENGIGTIKSKLPEDLSYKRKISVLMFLQDPFLSDYLKRNWNIDVKLIQNEISKVIQRFRGDVGLAINNKRSQWVDDIIKRVVNEKKNVPGKFARNFARLSRHPIWGFPILGAVVLVMYFLVVNVANGIADWMNTALWTPVEGIINNLVPIGILNEFLIGNYGILSLGIANAFLTVLPILTVFFFAFNILEDIGYIPNLCVLTKRVFEKIGLSGSAIMPLVLGFGCKTMATLTTKSLRSRKERYIAIFLIAFAIPCAAQTALNMSILGRMGIRAFLIAFSVLTFVEIVAGLILNKVMKDDILSDFIQELPAIRLPNPKAVLKKTYYRLFWFIKAAVPVFIYASIILFVFDKVGVLDAIKKLLSPIMIGFLGLPLEMVDALILCMARQEAAAGMIIKLIERGQLNYVQCIVSVTITTMFVPCFANIMAMVKELGAKSAIIMAVVINVSTFIIAGALNWILVSFFWL